MADIGESASDVLRRSLKLSADNMAWLDAVTDSNETLHRMVKLKEHVAAYVALRDAGVESVEAAKRAAGDRESYTDPGVLEREYQDLRRIHRLDEGVVEGGDANES